ncbi:PH domain-containing protein [Sphingorhabdus sp. SMR4y]|uniref:PH domain-containing protein n=1 Tax=Sphingorhabdus sp. SMR4y TaxID=2584094 RepID=UPI000B5C4890|nr:PH domain-containing protein [Sphingorhabdus sp. SMR4y]ASK89261.1 bacterial PH domain protein [Sphingorhabdus sp. SMR4y]
MTGAPETSTVQDSAPFRHLHPLSIILKSLSMIGRNIVAIAVLHFSLFDQNIAYTMLAALALVALVVGVTALIWSRFTYQVTDREIRIRSGLLNRNNRSIPFDRIQDVSLEQKLPHRLLRLATVALETGAGGGEDGQLEALTRSDAEELRDTIRDYKARRSAASPRSIEQLVTDEAPPLFAMDNRRIFIAGLFNFSFVLLAILGALAQNLDFLLPDYFFDPRNWFDALSNQEIIDGLSFWMRIAGVLGAIFSLVIIGFVSGIIRTFIREYGFRLDRVDSGQPGFRRRRGLFTLTDMVMPIHRVQAAIIQTGPVRQRFGWYHLKFKSLAGDASGESDHSAAPCATRAEIDAVLDQCAIRSPGGTVPFHQVNSALWWRRALLAVLLLAAIAMTSGTLFHSGFYLVLLLAGPVSLVLILSWRQHQYVLSDGQLFVRSGWWRRRLTLLPLSKIQTVDVSQTPWDHPLDLATIIIGIAGGSAIAPLTIRAIGLDQASDLRRQLLSRTASHPAIG